ncbi:MAG: hypothetical protein Q8Q04_03530 [archaeon]|nr:hypothetical protein [archaeon]
MEKTIESISEFRDLYNDEIKSLLDAKEYTYAYLLMVDPAISLKENWKNIAPKSHFTIILAQAAYNLSKDLEKYVENPSTTIEKHIIQNKKLLEYIIQKVG